jgi:magnesium chelatase family protein
MRVLKVARTIADLAGEEHITEEHLAEALSFRTIDRKYWGREC